MNKYKYLYRPAGFVLMLAFVVAIAALLPVPLAAQSFYGSIVGTVTDSTGAIVSGATVTATNKSTDEKHNATSNAAGEFQFVDLVPAVYSVAVERASFKRYIRDTVTVEVNTTTRVDAALQVGAATETVEVSTESALLQTDSGTVSTKVEGQQVQEMPLNGRNVMNLLELVPGVIPNNSLEQQTGMNNSGGTNPSGWNAFTTNGGDNMEYMDGAALNVLNAPTGGSLTLVPTQDATQEFSVDTNASGADSGRATGGVINMTSRSGTNSIHGSFYEYFRNADLNANTYFGNFNHQPRAQWNQNQYGANVGLPIKKDKMFFFGSWEALKVLTGVVNSTNVPTANMQAGIFPRKITDPNAATDGCVITQNAVAGTWTLGSGCLNPTTQVMKTYWPACVECSSTSANYYVNNPVGDDQNQLNTRYDWNVSSKQHFFVHNIWWHLQDIPQIPFPTETYWKLKLQYATFNNTTTIVGDTYTFNPKSVLDVRLSYLRFYFGSLSSPYTVNEGLFGANYAALEPYEAFKILPFPQLATGYNSLYVFGGSQGGTGGISQGDAHYDTYAINASLTRVVGRHSLKMGVEARYMDSENGGVNNTGNTSYGVNFSGSQSAGTGDEFADFLMGYPSAGTFSATVSTTVFDYYQGWYVQDTWQAARKLTVNLGLRWELPGGEAEKGNSMIVLEPNTLDPNTGITGTMALVASPLYTPRNFTPLRHDLFGPRAGFAYRLDDKTVLRGGYGITYEASDFDNSAISNHTNTVNNSIAASLTNPTGVAPTTLASNPFPNGVTPATRHSNPAFMEQLLIANPKGYAPSAVDPFNHYPYIQQWNFAVARTVGSRFQTSVSYVGTHGIHLPAGGPIDEIAGAGNQFGLTPAYTVTTTGTAAASSSGTQVPAQTAVAATGPYAGQALTKTTPFSTPDGVALSSWTVGNTLRPYPYYTNFTNSNDTYGNSHYNALQVQSQERLKGAGEIGGAFTWAKTIGDTGGNQDYNNHRGDRSVGGVPMRLAINYVLPLPFGDGQQFAHFSNGIANRLVSGWQFNGLSSFQHGGYLSIGASSNLLNKDFGAGGTRANYIPGGSVVVNGATISCNNNQHVSGAPTARLKQWFNTGCFEYPGDYSYGNQTGADPHLFGNGLDMWDIAMLKSTKITEHSAFQFRVETFNIFNHPQFSNPGTTVGSATYGVVSTQANNPRLVQLSARVNF